MIPSADGRSSLLATAFRMALGVSVMIAPPLRADILRGGAAPGPAAPAPGTPSGGSTPTAVDQSRANAQDTLARTTQALQAVRSMQEAARNNAINGPNHLGANPNFPGQTLPTVPNGLGSGGLQIDPRTATDPSWWQGAGLPTQTQADGKTQVTIKQTAQQALLNWETFNVGKDTKLVFDQSAGGSTASQWIAFNKVNDPTGNPTQILGSIQAQGQVYILNQNGILFGGSSQVNVHTLTASALPINTNLVSAGLLNNPDQQFLFSALAIPAGPKGTAAFTPEAPVNGRSGDVTVQAGARISTPVSADGNGGRILLVGANVTNAGTLSTPAGQTILAAGLQVGLSPHDSKDPSLRGLDVAIGAVVDPSSALAPYAGTVINQGLIEIARGSTVLAGKTVRQDGGIDGTTSVSLNGRIDLLANYDAIANPAYDSAVPANGLPFLARSTGAVTLGAGSVTRILPEWGSTEKAVGSQLALRSQINLQGRTIHLEPGSILLAPNALASLRAGTWGYVASTTRPTSAFIAAGGQVMLDSGAVINLAGTADASASVSQNLMTLELRGSELAPAPLQRDGELRGDTITVDLSQSGTYEGRFWVGTPLADLTGYTGLVQRDVGQLTTAGGSLEISAGGSVVLQNGSVLDVSGGWTNFTGGNVATTRVWSGGQIVDIASARPDQVYDGLFGTSSSIQHSKWGVAENYVRAVAPSGSRYQAGYTQGADAGAISISAPAMALDGALVGHSIAGANQIRSTPTSSALPRAASLTLRFQAQSATAPTFLTTFPTSPDILFRDSPGQTAAGPFAVDANGDPLPLGEERTDTVYLSPELLASQGFGHLTVRNEEGRIIVPEDTSLITSAGGSISLTSSNIDILGTVTATGGSLSFTALNISSYQAALLAASPVPQTPAANPGKGFFTLGAHASLSTAGRITDDRFAGDATTPATPDGGSIAIAGYSVDLAAGGTLDVSGGYAMTSKGGGRFGNAGTISIKAGQDPTLGSVLGGELALGATLLGYSGAKGGTLAIQAPRIQIGGGSSPGALVLQPEFFNQGGFGNFQLTGLGQAGASDAPAVSVAPGTLLAPIVKTLALDPSPGPGQRLTLPVTDEVPGVRQPVSLSLAAPGVRDSFTNGLVVRGDVVIGEGAVIRTDPQGSVSVTGNTVSILGSIVSPGGSITVAGGSDSTAIFGDPNQARATTYLGAASVLDARGTAVLLPDPYGRRTGSVLAGGTITVGGNLLASAGAVLDVSGASAVLDLDPAVAAPGTVNGPPTGSGLTGAPAGLVTVPVRIDSNAGGIVLRGGQMLESQATLLGAAGGPTALGGTLSVSSGRFYPQSSTPLPTDPTLVVTQHRTGSGSSATGIGQVAGEPLAHFAVDDFLGGGFDSLALGGVLRFSGPVDIAARGSLKIGDRGIFSSDSTLNLRAAYVALGTVFQPPVLPEEETSPFLLNGQPYNVPATHGDGVLTVRGGLIDVGNLSLQQIGSASLIAENGDIRGNGTLTIAGDLTLRAGQIYPTSASKFTITAYDYADSTSSHAGSITIQAAGSRSLPLSAGGTLALYASEIVQQGVLRAPFGTIQLGWDGTGTAPKDWLTGSAKAPPITRHLTLAGGSVTSVSGVDPLTGKGLVMPYGVSTNGTNWIDPRGVDISASGPPEKTIALAGGSVTTEAGSTIDLRGGGDLYADRWIAGLGGPVDILASSSRFAVIPGYTADYAPYAPYNASTATANGIAASGPGYTSVSLQVGDRIYLAGSATLPAGYYTLLPARYALLPGAVMVSPTGGAGQGTVEMPDRSSLVSGYRFNSLNGERTVPTLASRFEVASSAVVRQRAEYGDFLANAFLKASAASLNVATPRLPLDSGYLLFQATQSMNLAGGVASNSIAGGRGSSIDISTPLATVITGSGAAPISGVIQLDATALNSFGAESLLIGGKRTRSTSGTSVEVRSGSLTVDNSGSPLVAKDLVLVAKSQLTLAPGAELTATGTTAGETLRLIGDGALVRVTGGQADLSRSGVTSSQTPLLTLGAGARLSGGSLILDSSAGLSLDPTADLQANDFALHAGRISLLLDQPGELTTSGSLVLAGSALADLQGASSLSLLSYSSIDLYGTGQVGGSGLTRLTLDAGEIRGFHQNDGAARIVAGQLRLQNSNATAVGSAPGSASGSLEFQAGALTLGSGQLAVNQYANVTLRAGGGILGEGSGGLSAQNALTLLTPRLTGAAGAKRSLTAGGALVLAPGDAPTSSALATGGLGSTLTLTGASIAAGSEILLPSGSLSLHATTGDLTVTGRLDVSGTRRVFHDVAQYTDAGEIRLSADQGDVTLNASSRLDVSAQAGGGDAGTLGIATPQGAFIAGGTILGRGGNGGEAGNFELDTAELLNLAPLSAALSAASLTHQQTFRVRNGEVVVDGLALAHDFALSADRGGITVTGAIDASGATGGSIHLSASGSVTTAAGSRLSVAARDFSAAGKGGDITLEAGSTIDGVAGSGSVNLQGGSTLDLSVASKIAGDADVAGTSAFLGRFSGKLHLRAPRLGSDVAVGSIDARIIDASSILVEGARVYDFTSSGGAITTALQNQIKSDAESFLGAAGDAAKSDAIAARLLANQPGLASLLVVAPGVEIVNRTGDLTLGTTSSTAAADWNLAGWRFGGESAAGVLTLRAAGNLVFYNALSDGFTSSAYDAGLLTANGQLPVNTQSWSYRLVAGADLAAADFTRVRDLTALAAGSGSLQLGKNNGTNLSNSNGSNNTPGNNALTATALNNRFQVIRTGSGDIEIHAGRSVQLLNQFATVYTAGTQVADATLGGAFDLPVLNQDGGNATLGAAQQTIPYPVQYSMAGGDLTVVAGENIEHLTRNTAGQLVADSQRELPNNWLYRRGFLDPATGGFGTGRWGDVATTTWWTDFSNFFQSFGALAGGDVTLTAGHDISNVDAVIPTNARMPKGGLPDASKLIELGGGDLQVRAGNNLDAGVFYLERGHGDLSAGGSVVTNATRSPSVTHLSGGVLDSATWLPTTLFLGKGGFEVSARGDVLLGPVANAFLLPPGINNTFWQKSYFSTYGADSSVSVSSLGGAVTLRESATLPASGAGLATPLLQAWIDRQQLLKSNPASASFYQPWLRLAETSTDPFRTVVSLMPGTLRATSFSSDINLVGNLTLSPSPTGTLELLAAGAINGLQRNGSVSLLSVATSAWGASRINLSDADPAAIPGIASPFGYQAIAGDVLSQARQTRAQFLDFVDQLFRESGGTLGANASLESRQALHAAGLLHRGDEEPVRLYASGGDISGLTLFSPKATRVLAGRDISDIALYLQNLAATDTSVIASGRDLIAYQPNSPLRVAASQPGNIVNSGAGPQAGDLQISGPGSLQVIAGRNLDLGTGANNPDGTGTGLSSIGDTRNPYLPFGGANLLAAAGLGPSTGLAGSALHLAAFIDAYVLTPQGSELLKEIAPGVIFADQSADEQARLAIEVFYRILRNAGRDHPQTGNYTSALAAIETLFGKEEDVWDGDLYTRARDIRTTHGGSISILSPGGGLQLARTAIGNPLSPPGIITESGGGISIFAYDDIDIGIGRIFTLRGGDEILWSSKGDIAAGSSSKTVQSAPPTRVRIDPQSAAVQTDLSGLATGGGIGVLATVKGVPPGNVDLIAPEGSVDAGDAGIRVSGNLNIAARQVLNAGNIATGGTSTGTPPAAPAVPSVATVTAAAAAGAAAEGVRPADSRPDERPLSENIAELPSLISVEVLGYGGGEEEDEERRHPHPEGEEPPATE